MTLGLVVAGCVPLTREEAEEALDEANLHSQAVNLLAGTIKITENFATGSLVSDAAENLRISYSSQLPCATTAVDGATLTIQFGSQEDLCEFQGRRYTGLQQVTIFQNDEDGVVVDHVWNDLSNGEILVNGVAQVRWAGAADSKRTIAHELVWTRLADGRTASGEGIREQRPLGDLSDGIVVNGASRWKGESGSFRVSMDEVQMRWIDPVPQAGRYGIETPFNEDLTLKFERSAPTQVEVKAVSGKRSYKFMIATPE